MLFRSSGAAALEVQFSAAVRENADWSIVREPPAAAVHLRHRLADRANEILKGLGPAHSWLKRRLGDGAGR